MAVCEMNSDNFDYDSLVPVPTPTDDTDRLRLALLKMNPGESLLFPGDSSLGRRVYKTGRSMGLQVRLVLGGEQDRVDLIGLPLIADVTPILNRLACSVSAPEWMGSAGQLFSVVKSHGIETFGLSVKVLGRRLVALSKNPDSGVTVDTSRKNGNGYRLDLHILRQPKPSENSHLDQPQGSILTTFSEPSI